MIEAKAKPCKGTGLAKGWGCGKITKYRKYGLCKMNCYPDWLLNSENGKIKLEKATLKAIKPRLELEKKEKEHKERKGITTLINAAKNACHEYIRARDHGKPCISCGTPYKSDFDAGHFYSANQFPWVRFHENNIAGQCIRCNRMLEGNINMYEMRLPGRIGNKSFEELKELARNGRRSVFKWDREELKEITNYYRTKIKELTLKKN